MNNQVQTFIITIATGIILGVMLDFYRIFRINIRKHYLCTMVTDLIYWLLATIVIFIALLIGNWGELRLYVFLGLAVGAISYFRIFSKKFIFIVMSFITTTKILISKVIYCIKIIIMPFIKLIKIILYPLLMFKRMFKNSSIDDKKEIP